MKQEPVGVACIKVALVDVDGTLIRGQTYAHILKVLLRRPRYSIRVIIGVLMMLPSHIARRRSMARRMKSQDRWARMMAWILSGLTPAQVREMLHKSDLVTVIRPEMLAEIRTRQHEGCKVVLASTAVEPVVGWLAGTVGVDGVVATSVQVENGRYGKLAGPICNGKRKVDAIEALMCKWEVSVDWEHSWAYSDGFPDMPMLEKVGHPVAIAPDPSLGKVAQERKWAILECASPKT